MTVRFSSLSISVALLALSGCLEPTQLTFDISTDVPCDQFNGARILVGLEGQAENGDPVAVAARQECSSDGTTSVIGTYTVTPSASRNVIAAIKVVMAVGPNVDVESDCNDEAGYANCIVARRRVKFVEHRNLLVPISMPSVCKGNPCDATTTCDRAGRCVDSLINTDLCKENGCPLVMTGSGLPCFNDGQKEVKLCDDWCTREPDGTRDCANSPSPTGISFQCRDSTDCQPNQQCVQGDAGILAKCIAMAKAGDVVLCTTTQPLSPCAMGASGCTMDAGFGLLTCLAKTDAGVKDGGADAGRDAGTLDAGIDAGPVDAGAGDAGADAGRALPCPQSSTTLACSGATPFCSGPTGTPSCVSDGGAQCWFATDCSANAGCFASSSAPFFSVCAPAATSTYPVTLCNPSLDAGDCPAGAVCDGVFFGATACRVLDAGVVDSGVSDAGSSDAGAADAGVADAGRADAGSTDSGVADAGVTDAGVADAGRADGGSDAGMTDAGRADAGDGG